MLRKKDHVLPAARGVTSEMFHGYREEYEWIEDYIAQHRRTPSIGAFRDAFEEVAIKNVDDVEEYIERVRQAHSVKIVRNGLQQIINELKNENVTEAIKKMTAAAVAAEASIQGHGSDGDIFKEYGDIKDEVLRRKERSEKTGFAGIPTGFPTLDELTGGIQPGWFVLISARAGIGKTRSLIRMACAAAFSGYTVQYDALEQTRPEIAMQVHSFASSEFGHSVFKSLDLAQGKGFETGTYLKFLQSMKETIQGKMHVADGTRGSITPMTMAAQIERNRAEILFLDFLTLLEGADDWQSTANLSTEIKRMAQRYRIPIVSAAQVNRKGEGSREQGLDTIAGTDRLGQDADLVINARKFSKSVIVMTVVKFRHGPEGQQFYLKFDPNMGVMEEITYEQAMDLKDKDSDREEKEQKKAFKPRQRGSFHAAAVANRSAKALSTPEEPKHKLNGAVVRKQPAGRPVRLRRVR
jgi:replicative DNA helicase